MLPRMHRLVGDSNFSRILRKGNRFFSKALMARVIQNDLAVSRFAFVVSAKVSKKANQRNLLKRRMREIVRHEMGNITNGYDVLISAKHDALRYTFDQLKQEIISLLKKTHLYSL